MMAVQPPVSRATFLCLLASLCVIVGTASLLPLPAPLLALVWLLRCAGLVLIAVATFVVLLVARQWLADALADAQRLHDYRSNPAAFVSDMRAAGAWGGVGKAPVPVASR